MLSDNKVISRLSKFFGKILNYCTLVPDISYLIACEPINAEIIEKGFKHRFNNFRPTIDGGLHRRRFPKSESYEVDFKWLFLLLIHALHADSEPLVYISNKNSFLNPKDKKQKYENKYSIELSNYYFKPGRFKSETDYDGSLVWDGRSSWFEIGYLKTKKSKNIEFFYWDISKKDFKNIQKKIPFRRVEFYEKDERVSIRNSFTKGLKQKKIVFKSSNFFLAETRAKRIIFKMLCDRKIIREYDYDNKQKKTGQDTLRYRTLSWYPYDKPYSFDKNKKYMISGYDKDI
tara:strand:+ start:12797 stop:13660 length:864 start_codon:yes stop_codon:yes gene_type:complete